MSCQKVGDVFRPPRGCRHPDFQSLKRTHQQEVRSDIRSRRPDLTMIFSEDRV
jgi:hypothetical protein